MFKSSWKIMLISTDWCGLMLGKKIRLKTVISMRTRKRCLFKHVHPVGK